jgi:precorrin-3B C17-methyltransferase
MSAGRLTVVGLGPGPASWMTGAAHDAIAQADVILGYTTYTDRLTLRADQRLMASDNREELARAKDALRLAAGGHVVAVVSGGDPGVFAMAAAIFEAIEAGDPSWRALDVRVEPGVTAMLAVAARLGAPLGHDFCAISLSDNLKPWTLIEARLRAAADAGFVIALYNPASKARPQQIVRAFEVLRERLPAHTVVAFAKAAGRENEAIHITTLSAADPGRANMQTLVLIGSAETRTIERADGSTWVYTPRSTERS